MHIRGIILEGYSNAGKTSILKEIKQQQAQDETAERSVIVLGEHYSQILNKVRGKLVHLTQSEHMNLLQERVELLKGLNKWAITLGAASRQSRGLFFVLERFHLNHRAAFYESLSSEIESLENDLVQLGAKCVLLTLSSEVAESRIQSRNPQDWAGKSSEALVKACNDLLYTQEKLREQAMRSKVPTIEINTDTRDWKKYTADIFNFIDNEG